MAFFNWNHAFLYFKNLFMKKTLSSFLLLFLFFGIGGNVFAEEECEITTITEWYEKIYSFEVSPDGESIAYVVRKEWKMALVKDWKELWKYDNISNFEYLSDNEGFVFVATKEWKQFVVKNWEESKKYDSITTFKLSSDRKSFAFEWDIYAPKEEWVFIVWWPEIEKCFLVKDLKEIEYDYLCDSENHYSTYNDHFLYSENWESFAFTAKENWKQFVVKDWIESEKYDRIKYLLYSQDNKSFSFIWGKNFKNILVKDWIESKEYDDIIGLRYLQNGKGISFL